MAHIRPDFSILELGTVSEEAASTVLSSISRNLERSKRVKYTFTCKDQETLGKISEHKFSERKAEVTFEVLDVEKDLKSQAFEGRTYDLIISSDTFGTAPCFNSSFRNVRKLLKLDGKLCFTRICEERSRSSTFVRNVSSFLRYGRL